MIVYNLAGEVIGTFYSQDDATGYLDRRFNTPIGTIWTLELCPDTDRLFLQRDGIRWFIVEEI